MTAKRPRAPRRVPLHTALPLLRLVLTAQQEAALDVRILKLVMSGRHTPKGAEAIAKEEMLRGEL